MQNILNLSISRLKHQLFKTPTFEIMNLMKIDPFKINKFIKDTLKIRTYMKFPFLFEKNLHRILY